jgi:hypothetical protein
LNLRQVLIGDSAPGKPESPFPKQRGEGHGIRTWMSMTAVCLLGGDTLRVIAGAKLVIGRRRRQVHTWQSTGKQEPAWNERWSYKPLDEDNLRNRELRRLRICW